MDRALRGDAGVPAREARVDPRRPRWHGGAVPALGAAQPVPRPVPARSGHGRRAPHRLGRRAPRRSAGELERRGACAARAHAPRGPWHRLVRPVAGRATRAPAGRRAPVRARALDRRDARDRRGRGRSADRSDLLARRPSRRPRARRGAAGDRRDHGRREAAHGQRRARAHERAGRVRGPGRDGSPPRLLVVARLADPGLPEHGHVSCRALPHRRLRTPRARAGRLALPASWRHERRRALGADLRRRRSDHVDRVGPQAVRVPRSGHVGTRRSR